MVNLLTFYIAPALANVKFSDKMVCFNNVINLLKFKFLYSQSFKAAC